MKNNLYLVLYLLLASCSGNGGSNLPNLSKFEISNNDISQNKDELEFQDIFYNKEEISSFSTLDNFTMNLNEVDGEETLSVSINPDLYSFPLSSFENKDNYYKAVNSVEYGEASISFIKDLDLSYGNIALLGYTSNGYNQVIFYPLLTINNDTIINKIDETINFNGKVLLNFFSISKNNVNINNHDETITGNANLILYPNEQYNLTMNFDNFYSVNIKENEITLFNNNKIPKDFYDNLALVHDNYKTKLKNHQFNILGENKNPEEVVGNFTFNIENNDKKTFIDGIYGVKKINNFQN